ncbi:hypothetical protein NQ314_016130 [Rhamnusium bicolor]|uniref:Uncharacterized protein n=1 Tax=Rhamnusium bicolor TaxID=1586634 RepID=A0AAV8WX14_9CUCU|nr:hypothetical protein NQ314_016130 [Rhamnusium bicolor]
MSNQEKGEHSRRSEPNEDEKPLKKARYVWEVKGKYHLKDTYKNNNSVNKNNNTDASLSGNSKKCIEEDTSKHPMQNEGENNSAKKQNESCNSSKCCIESFLAKTEAIMDSDVDDDDIPMSNIDCNILNEIPVTLVSPIPRNQDYYLRKWQARQIARGFVDNTINSVLETWINPPFDAADFVENCDNDGQVEDDAILMAIRSHGLQANARGNMQFSNSTEEKEIAFVRSPEIEESTLDNFENYQNELIKEQENISNSSTADSMSCDSSISNQADEGDLDLGDPMDFLNAAVSVAIQKKGLSYGY